MASEFLFSYGTLQLPVVQMTVFRRRLTGTRDVLPKFAEAFVAIEDHITIALSGKAQHAIARYTGRDTDAIEGTVFAISHDELLKADAYESGAYVRVAVSLKSGAVAWAYVDDRHRPPPP